MLIIVIFFGGGGGGMGGGGGCVFPSFDFAGVRLFVSCVFTSVVNLLQLGFSF